MKVRLLDDLHLEFDWEAAHKTRLYDPNAPKPRYPHMLYDPGNVPADALVLAGDITVLNLCNWAVHPGEDCNEMEGWFVDRLADYELVLHVPGNHEYYGGTFLNYQSKFAEWTQHINAIAKARGYKGIFYCGDRYTVMKDGVKFICATLWTDFHRNDPMVSMRALQMMSDYSQIKFDKKRLLPAQILQEHEESRAFIEKEIANYDGKKVVVTHHAPSAQSVHAVYKSRDLDNYLYYSDLDHLVEQVDLWCHGHTHRCFDYNIGKGRVVCNPRGYFPYETGKTGFDPLKVIEL
jgi:UDP-2,3-diacylglucosamine pyrophosphatase LpxH